MKDVSNELVNALFEHSEWKTAGVEIGKDEVIAESKNTDTPEGKPTKHVCPLCESELKEALSDERLLEHSQEVLNVFEAVQELISESEEATGDEDDEDEDAESEEDEDEDEYDSEDEDDE